MRYKFVCPISIDIPTQTMVIDVLNSIFFVFSLISLPLYVLLLATLIKFRHFLKSHYYTFFLSTGIADLAFTMHKYLTRNIPGAILGDEIVGNIFLATVARAGNWSIYFTQILGILFMTLNRTTALGFPTKHKTIWSPKVVRSAIAVQWILPLGFAVPMAFPYCYSNYTAATEIRFISPAVHKIYFLIDMLLEPGVLGPCLVSLYVFMFYKSRKHGNKVTAKDRNQQKLQQSQLNAKRAEVNLAITGAVLSAIYVLLCALYVAYFFEIYNAFTNNAFYYLSDLFTMSNPYLILICARKVRAFFRAFILCKNPSDILATVTALPGAAAVRPAR